MFLLQSPPPTRYDLNFIVAGIPVRVHPLFWLFTIILGWSGGILSLLIWVFVVFVSILIHELGHALAFRRFGVDSYIVLHFAGGLTIPQAAPWGGGWANVSPSPRQQIGISLAGPFSGFILAALVIITSAILFGGAVGGYLFGFIPVPQLSVSSFGGNVINIFIERMLWANLFWGFVNLLPVFPLDGGQVVRNILVQSDPWDGVRKSIWVSVITGVLVALIGLFIRGGIFMVVLFGLLAFQSYQALQVRY